MWLNPPVSHRPLADLVRLRKIQIMTEAAISGMLMILLSAGVLGVGFATGKMPFNYISLDTARNSAPTTFWAFAASWTLFAILGVAIALKH